MNLKNSISLNFPAIIHGTLEILKRFIFPKFHETLQAYWTEPLTEPKVPT